MRSNKLLIIYSSLLTLIFLELLFNFIIFPKNDYNYKNRYLIFSEGKIFKNIDNFFTYEPNKELIASNYYFNNGEFNLVYKHKIYTNNLGLVQKTDIDSELPSILFLGDSFTEGQGAESWINQFNGKYKNYQIINGGFLSTVFQQFNLIDNYLSKNDIQKVFVLFIGDDLRRDIFQFNNQQLDCLNNHKLCNGNENFYGFPLSKKEPQNFLTNLRNKQFNKNEIKNIDLKKLRRNLKSSISELYIFKIPINFLKSHLYKSKNEKILKNFKAINSLVEKYDNDIFFIHLHMKEEILNKKRGYESIYVSEHIKSITKNYFTCTFDKDISNFYNFDQHPNAQGYENLYQCILNIFVKEKI